MPWLVGNTIWTKVEQKSKNSIKFFKLENNIHLFQNKNMNRGKINLSTSAGKGCFGWVRSGRLDHGQNLTHHVGSRKSSWGAISSIGTAGGNKLRHVFPAQESFVFFCFFLSLFCLPLFSPFCLKYISEKAIDPLIVAVVHSFSSCCTVALQLQLGTEYMPQILRSLSGTRMFRRLCF